VNRTNGGRAPEGTDDDDNDDDDNYFYDDCDEEEEIKLLYSENET
jgi:hypothetical protein